MQSALTDAHGLGELLTAIDQDLALDAVHPGTWSRAAWIAANYIDRALELQMHAEGQQPCMNGT